MLLLFGVLWVHRPVGREEPNTESEPLFQNKDLIHHHRELVIMGLMDAFRNRFPADQDDEEDEIEVNDEDANGLTTIGRAAYNVLSKQHGKHHSTLWNVTSGRIIGELDLSPKGCFGRTEDPPDGHSDWLPEKMGAMLKLTKT